MSFRISLCKKTLDVSDEYRCMCHVVQIPDPVYVWSVICDTYEVNCNLIESSASLNASDVFEAPPTFPISTLEIFFPTILDAIVFAKLFWYCLDFGSQAT